MTTDPDTILLTAEEQMAKAVDYLQHELRGIRAGRATPAIVEFVKVECYGAQSDLKAVAAVSVPEPTQLLIKPFDPGTLNSIRQGIEQAGLGLNPQIEDKQIRINLPALSSDRRKELVAQAKKVGEEQKVAMRNARRDANKQADALGKGSDALSEDEVKTLHAEIQDLLKKYEAKVEEHIASKAKEITEI
ncbi:MAG: ribosome-recycling factor [Phycisphaeraceae bacterium]|nr:MAG: ribosome-recycling factor [Phycisphaeraceae bacterium]